MNEAAAAPTAPTELTELTKKPRSRLRSGRWWMRVVAGTGVALYFLVCALVLVLRYGVLPKLTDYREEISALISERVGERVEIGSIAASWRRIYPSVDLGDIRVYDRLGNVALHLPSISAELSWQSLLLRDLRLHSVVIEAPFLSIRRSSEGRLFIAGIEVDRSASPSEPALSDWVLRQGEVVIRNGKVDWTDEQRGAPPLALSGAEVRLVNHISGAHDFALAATLPAELGSKLDLRGHFRGRSLAEQPSWQGTLYAETAYTDLAALRRWISYPFEVASGRGGVRLWLGVERGRVVNVSADLALAQLSARMRRGLPALELASLSGRIAAQATHRNVGLFESWDDLTRPGQSGSLGYRVSGAGIVLVPKRGPAHEPLDFSLQWDGASDGRSASGKLSLSKLALAPLAQLAGSMPLPTELRRFLNSAEPKGLLNDAKFAWTGPLAQPQSYSASTQFEAAALKPFMRLPGASGLSGSFSASERAGVVSLASKGVAIDYAPAFRQASKLSFDSLAGQIAWTWGEPESGDLELKFSNIVLANQDFSGTASGLWRALPRMANGTAISADAASTADAASPANEAGKPADASSLASSFGFADLSARFAYVDLRALYRYIPFLDGPLASWLKGALIAGQAADVQLKLRGELIHFPFADLQQGSFQVQAKVARATFDIGDGWPRFENIEADYSIDGPLMRVSVPRATVLNTEIADVHMRIPDFLGRDPVLDVDGHAAGATLSFLDFIARSPVSRWLSGATEDIRTEGTGRLALKLVLPLRRQDDAKLTGSYQFSNNRVLLKPTLPPLDNANGQLDFTETALSARAIHANFLGGQTAIGISTRADHALVIAGEGNASMQAVASAFEFPLSDHAQGAAGYRANVLVAPKSFELKVESNLQGVSIDLPAPFGKAASESVPFKLERTIGDGAHDSLAFALGDNLKAQARFNNRGNFGVERMTVALGDATAAIADRPGLTVIANMKEINVDQLDRLGLLPGLGAANTPGAANPPGAANTSGAGIAAGAANPPSAASTDSSTAIPLSALDVRTDTLTIFGRNLHELALRARPQDGGWSAKIDARELAGDIAWRPQGRGRVIARLGHLSVPEAATAGSEEKRSPALRELPAVDLVAERFSANGRELGHLELEASNEAQLWRIHHLVLLADEGSIRAEGTWHASTAASAERSDLSVVIETENAGKYLQRFGQPNAVRAGHARLDAKLSWNGAPYALDYASLAGDFEFQTGQGQFLKIEPGIGRLLGVLSLQALPRRITLDFRDVFSEGFAFDEIHATARADRGVLHTDDFRMRGPAATVFLSGDTDLARETERLHVRVVPVIGDSVAAVAGLALLNPLVGIGTFLAQRLLRDPLGRIFTYEYQVTGSWSDPKVERAGAPMVERETDKGYQ